MQLHTDNPEDMNTGHTVGVVPVEPEDGDHPAAFSPGVLLEALERVKDEYPVFVTIERREDDNTPLLTLRASPDGERATVAAGHIPALVGGGD